MTRLRILQAIVLAIAFPLHLIKAQGVPAYLAQIVQANAPIIIEETTDNGEPNQRRVNHLMRIDFDGDYNGANNDQNAINQYYPLPTPTVYYSVVETPDAYYIGYYFYHIRDNGTRAWSNTGGHQHDLEGIWKIVEKSSLYPNGYSRFAWSQAHGAMLPFYDPDWFSQPPVLGIPGEFQHYPIGQIHKWLDPYGVNRSVVAVRESDHGTYMAQRCDQWVDMFWDQGYGMMPNRGQSDPYGACIHGSTNAMIYLPAPYGCAPSNGCSIDAIPTGASTGSYYYALTSLFDDGAFWPTRQVQNEMFGGNYIYLGGNQWGYYGFHGTDYNDGANPPWAWYGSAGDCKDVLTVIACWYSYGSDDTDNYWWDRVFWPQFAYGTFLGSPVSVAHEYWPSQNWSTSYVYNPFVGGAGSYPPNLSAYIDGPTSFNDFNQFGTWNAGVTGGTPPYTYQWSGEFTGTSSSVSGTVTENGELFLDVWDAAGVHLAVSTYLTYCSGGVISC